MWSLLLLSALSSLVASSHHGWQSNIEYEYKVHGRTLTALHDIANQYSGIVLKARLFLRPENGESIMAKIVDVQYSQVHANLPEGWRSEIDEHNLKYKQLEFSQKPFQIVLRKGVIRDLIVDRAVANWEANIIKAIVSQVQLDIQGENLIKAHLNQLPETDSNSAVFKTMEDTITGTYETLYDISTLPTYVWQAQPELVPMPELRKDGEIIEIVKTKNYSRSEERLGYHFGFGASGPFERITNHMGEFFIRSGYSRMIVSGNLSHYTIQSASSTNKVILSPNLNSKQKGMVVSHLNLTLADMAPTEGQYEHPQEGQKLGSLTYTFNTPFSGTYEVRQGAQRQPHEYMYSSEEEDLHRHYRQPRSIHHGEESVESEEDFTQGAPTLNQPPQSPFLPLYIGYKGKSVNYSDTINVVEIAAKLARQIGKEIQDTQEIPKEQTLAKFVMLSSVARIMNNKEMEQVTQKLYTQESNGPWKAYRDAIAESGTGPALLTIKEWIKANQIRREEAAEVIANFANSVRQPTEEFMRVFYELCYKEDYVNRHAVLNETAILSYASLARRVYVNKLASRNQYPVHSFGSFRTKHGKEFVAEELVPHLGEELHQAIRNADSYKLLVYIRALGNVAHQKILEVFEPYLEGKTQCSQFQRLQMVIALDKFVKIHPKTARSVLYKIYQNAGEAQEIRVAAVYQLIRTGPPASMLQRMAQYTNADNNQQVNAAVKSTIESASQLKGDEFAELRVNARAAKPLLTKDNYGIHYSHNYLRDYVSKELNLYYKQTYQTYGSHDSYLPKGFKYALRAGLGGSRRQLIIAQAMVSSIDELTNVFQRQTARYEKQQEQQQQGYQQAKQQAWSSEYIAEKLNIEHEEREQLEGNFLVQLAGGMTRYFAFNNHTINLLPQVLHEIEEALRDGEEINYTKFINRQELCIALPTETAFPFIYTLDSPTLFQFEGRIRAIAEPQISNGQVIRYPQTISAHAEIHAVVSSKLQARIGFITTFDHQHYVAGYDKNMHIDLPIKSQYKMDLKDRRIHAQFQPFEHAQDHTVFHYSSWPYTAKHNILQFEPIANDQNTKLIAAEGQPQTQWNATYGKESGMAFRVHYASEEKFANCMWLYEQYKRNDLISALLASRYDETIQHAKLDVEYASQETSAHKVQISFGYNSYDDDDEQEEGNGHVELSQFSHLPHEYKARQYQFARIASAGIANSSARIMDFAVEFDGQQKTEYIATIAVAASPVAQKARVLLFFKKHGTQSYEIAFSGSAYIPITDSLDYTYAWNFDPTITAQAELAFGPDLQSATKTNWHVKLHQSDERKQYLKSSSRALECNEEMKRGNKQLPACANMTIEANLLDSMHYKVELEPMTPLIPNTTYWLYNYVRYISYYYLDENVVDPQTMESENQWSIQARFEPDFEAVNVTIKNHEMESHINKVRVNEWAQRFFGVQPGYRKYDRIMGYAYGYDTYRPFCIVDHSAANTFDNQTYDLDLNNTWTVMMYYAPQYARVGNHQLPYQQQQQQFQMEQYAVVVREDKSGQYKEVKMTLRTPETQGRTIEFDFKPRGQCGGNQACAKIYYNGSEIQYDNHQAYNIHHGFVKIYALPNGEIKCEVKNAFYIIYDIERVQITATHDKLRGSIRGLCGTHDGEETTDFLGPENCIYPAAEEFVASYQVEEGQERQNGQKQCIKHETEYANVISHQDAGRQHQQYHQRYQKQFGNHQRAGEHQENAYERHIPGDEESCVYHQTRYHHDVNNNEICFSIRPIPVCRMHCNAENVIEKSVPVYCTQMSSNGQLWKEQIDNGASPDFSDKMASKSIKMAVHEACARS